jgi:hypothetical protein
MKRVGSATIQFRDLHPYMFCEGYKLPKGPSGKYQLTFSTAEGKQDIPLLVRTKLTCTRCEGVYGHLPPHQDSTTLKHEVNNHDFTTKSEYE